LNDWNRRPSIQLFKRKKQEMGGKVAFLFLEGMGSSDQRLSGTKRNTRGRVLVRELSGGGTVEC